MASFGKASQSRSRSIFVRRGGRLTRPNGRQLATVLAAGLLLASALLSHASAHPTRDRADKIQEELEDLVDAGIPGITVLLRDGAVTTTFAAGVADITTDSPVTSDMRFRVASIAKSFVAAVVFQLVDEGTLSLDDTLKDWLPGLVPNGRHITVEQLLGHRSGLTDYGVDPSLFLPYLSGDLGFRYSPLDLVAMSVAQGPAFPPGGGPGYSSTDYVLLGLIIEAATGNKLGAEMKARIMEPLGLESTTFATTGRLKEPFSHGYIRNGAKLLDGTFINPSYVWAAGNVVSTVSDISTFYDALYAGELMSSGLVQQMEEATFNPSKIGLGIFQQPYSCGLFYGHDGTMPGYFVFAYNSEDNARQFVMFANSNSLTSERVGSPRAQRLLHVLAETAACE
jgi:D-alanyl-D-alanine carboxypeptidase